MGEEEGEVDDFEEYVQVAGVEDWSERNVWEGRNKGKSEGVWGRTQWKRKVMNGGNGEGVGGEREKLGRGALRCKELSVRQELSGSMRHMQR